MNGRTDTITGANAATDGSTGGKHETPGQQLAITVMAAPPVVLKVIESSTQNVVKDETHTGMIPQSHMPSVVTNDNHLVMIDEHHNRKIAGMGADGKGMIGIMLPNGVLKLRLSLLRLYTENGMKFRLMI